MPPAGNSPLEPSTNLASKVADVFSNMAFKKDVDDFHWTATDEPHATRRKLILKAHPEIRQLFGPEPLTAWIVLGITLSQVWICSWIHEASWPVFLVVMYVYGATVNHSLQLANHEISHNLCFHNFTANRAIGIIANFATAFPSSIMFKAYHMEHHQYQGVDVVDTDIPTAWEVSFFKTRLRKALWMFLQPAFYTLRPTFTNPKPPTVKQAVNFVAVFTFDAWIYYMWGAWAIGYLVMSTLVGLGLHPTAGHFIAEHYEFVCGHETYSYYGSCNYVNFNVGYHNEHHDFPRIAWSRLARVREIAPEWYNHLPHHSSYIKVLWHYIMDDSMGPWSRVKRKDCALLRKKMLQPSN